MIFEATITIDAPPEVVWEVLLDLAGYPAWDASCERIEGELRLGGRLRVHSHLSPGRPFAVRVAELQPTTMVWTGGMPLGLFRGRRTLSVEPHGSGARFTLREQFSGPLRPLMARVLPDFAGPFQAACEGLKRRVEARPMEA